MKQIMLVNPNGFQNLTATVIFLFIMNGCGFPPINSTFDSARTLGLGNMELSGNYSKYTISSGQFNSSNYSSDELNLEFNNYGFRIGFGASENVDIKIRYERITRNGLVASYVEINPKFSLKKNKRAFSIPIGTYSTNASDIVVLSPKFLFTETFSDNFDLSYSIKLDVFPVQLSSIQLGLNLGTGFSNNLKVWAIRPEIGLMISMSGLKPILTYGIGFNFTL